MTTTWTWSTSSRTFSTANGLVRESCINAYWERANSLSFTFLKDSLEPRLTKNLLLNSFHPLCRSRKTRQSESVSSSCWAIWVFARNFPPNKSSPPPLTCCCSTPKSTNLPTPSSKSPGPFPTGPRCNTSSPPSNSNNSNSPSPT